MFFSFIFLLQSVDTVNRGEYIKSSVVKAIGKHSNINQQTQIKSAALTLTMVKQDQNNNNQTIYEGLGKSNVPSLCNLNPNNDPNACNNYKNVTMTVSFNEKNN